MIDGSKVYGSEYPRIFTQETQPLTPETTMGFGCIQFAENILGLTLNPWQKYFLKRAFELNDARTGFRYRTVLLLVARQNGKSLVMIVATLFMLLVVQKGELAIGTAQDLETSEDTWAEGLSMLQDHPVLAKQITKENRTNGKKSFELANGSEWKVKPSNRKGGRGKSAVLVLMDELREQLNWDAWNAVSNTTIARQDAQVWGVSNAGDVRSVVLKAQRDKAIAEATNPETTILICEWSAPEDADLDDETVWGMANPSLGYTITIEALRHARSTSTDTGWQTENLCQWVTAMDGGPWADGVWEAAEDMESVLDDTSEVFLCVDTAMDRSYSYVGIVGANTAGLAHLEIIAMRAGDAWVPKWIDDRFDAIQASRVVIQGRGAPATGLISLLEDRGIPVFRCEGRDVTASAMEFFAAVRDGLAVHRMQSVLNIAALAAATRVTGDGVWMFDRRKSPVDIAPLIALSMGWYVYAHRLEIEDEAETSAYEDHDVIFA